MAASGAPSLELQILDDLSFVVACLSSCICVLAVVLRFAGKASAALDSIRTNAYGMYLVHYLFVVWLQYVLLGAELPALIKGALVFCGTLALSWGAIATARHLRQAAGPMIAVDRVRDSRAA
jgi:peptidoglycan/LPS O-acetylase OafA/YrhL